MHESNYYNVPNKKKTNFGTWSSKKPKKSKKSKILRHVCECHKIDWEDHRDGAFHYKNNGKAVVQKNSLDCQTKVNRNDMTLDEYFGVCQQIPSQHDDYLE